MSRIEQLERLLEAEPGDAFLLYAMAQEQAKADRHDEAVGYYDKCLETDEGYCYAYYHKAVSLDAMGRSEEAADTLRAGMSVAKGKGDQKALLEMSGLLDGIG